MRHTLIRLRAQKPILFGNRPIPLREDDIKRDDTFTAILAQEVVHTYTVPIFLPAFVVLPRFSHLQKAFFVWCISEVGAGKAHALGCGTAPLWRWTPPTPPAHAPCFAAFQATARAHRHEASGGHSALFADGDVDVELDTDKQKKRMAVDHGRVRTSKPYQNHIISLEYIEHRAWSDVHVPAQN